MSTKIVTSKLANTVLRRKLFAMRIKTLVGGAVFTYTALAALGVFSGLVSMLLGAAVYGMPMFLSYFSSPALVALNILPPVLLILLVYFISGRAWISFSVSALFVLALSAAAFFKIQVRGDPLTAADILLINEVGEIVSSYKLTMNWKLYAALAFFVLGAMFSVFCIKRVQKGVILRSAGAAAVIIVSAALFMLAYTSAEVYRGVLSGGGTDELPYSEGFVARGFVYPFIYSISHTAADKPTGYTEEEAKQLLESFSTPAQHISSEPPEPIGIPDDKKVNVISIMLESYCDLSVFGAIDFEIDVYGPLHELQRESVSGSLIDNVFAGNTIDTERLFLTGYTKLERITKPTDSFVYYLREQGYYTEGMHAGDGWFYDRDVVNKYLGFDEYYFLEDYEDSNRNDSFFFPAVKSLYDERDPDKPYFSFSLSYQNHGSYYDFWTEEPFYLKRGDMSEESFNILNNYLTGIYDTTRRVADLADSLRDDPVPVILVIFGDHMPWLGNGEAVYREIGINADTRTDEGFYNMYSTPYIIWANPAARKALGGSFTGDGGSFSPCFLMSKLFEVCSWEGGEYMSALNEMKGYTDVINAATGYFRENGRITYSLSEEAKRFYEDFKKIEYYRLHNFSFKPMTN